MKKLIIESGSTKADWLFLLGTEKILISTKGMNPTFIGEDDISEIFEKEVRNRIPDVPISEVHFFGAGCSGPAQQQIVVGAFRKIFPDAAISAKNDIVAAVYATCGNNEGIVSIIGTGSNCVYFDGKNIQLNNFGLGFILADEGAGTYLGKKIITAYLYGALPENLEKDFRDKYKLTRDEAIKQVYGNASANTWLASFASFYTEHLNDKWITNTVIIGFQEFIKLYILTNPRHKSVPIHFIGSIAYYFQNILKDVSEENQLELGKIIQRPMDELIEYFSKSN